MTARPAPVGHCALRATAGYLPILLVAGCGFGESSSSLESTPDVFTVERQTMSIRVTESAELKAAKETRIRSDVEGSATIIYLVPEGEVVEEGTKLVELDVSELEERRANQAISVEKAYAALVNARQNLEILQKELDSLEAAATSGLEIARLNLEKFLGSPAEHEIVGEGDDIRAVPRDPDAPMRTDGNGGQVRGTNRDMVGALRTLVSENPAYSELPDRVVALLGTDLAGVLDRDMGELGQQILEQVDQITLALQELALAQDTYDASLTLRQDEYITANDLRRDELAMKRQLSNVQLSWQKLDILIGYTLRVNYIDLKLKLDNAELELDKVRASNAARRTREEAEMSSAQSEYDLAKERLENLEKQIGNAILYAPTPGLVVYSSLDSRGREMVEEGVEVRERQTMLTLPDVTQMQAELKIQEADVDKVRRGQMATIEVDAFPGEVFTGRVTRVSPIADSGSRWSNSNLKVYKTWVSLEHDNADGELKPNMAARVTILVGELENALPVPITAVRRQGKVNYVWKKTSGGPVATPVDVGRSTNEEVEVVGGIEPGDQIFKAPPPGAVPPQFEQPEAELEAPSLGSVAEEDAERAALAAKLENVTTQTYYAEIKARLPQFAELVDSGDRRAMFQNQEFRDAIEADPVLSAMSAKIREQMMERMRREGGGRRPGGDAPGGGGGSEGNR